MAATALQNITAFMLPAAPAQHRGAVTVADTNPPGNIAGQIVPSNNQYVDLDITLAAGAANATATLAAYFWNSRLSVWFQGETLPVIQANANTSFYQTYRVETRGRPLWIGVTAISGTSASVSIDAVLS